MKNVRLSDLCSIRYGKDHKKLGPGNIPAYGSGGIMRYVDKAIHDRPSVLIPRKGSLNNLFFTDEPFWTVDTLFWTEIDDDKVLPKYLFYVLEQKNLSSLNEGTAVPSLTTKTLNEITIALPSIERQREIIEKVEPLESKIKNNNQINDNLQKQAEAIYSRLFIDARNCNQVPLKDIANITMGQSPAGHSCSEKNEGTVFYQGRAEFGFRFPTRRLFTTEPKRMAKVGDILLSVRAPVGDTNVAYEDCCIGRGLSAIESKTGESSFLLYTLRYLNHQFEVFNAEGTVFGSINKEQLNNFQINLPPTDKIKEFESTVRPMDDLIRMNFKESNLLNELREKLLLNFFSNK